MTSTVRAIQVMLLFVLCCLGVFAKERIVETVRVTVVENLPTTTSYTWKATGQPVVTCYSFGCAAYITRFIPNRNPMRAEVKLLLPDGTIDVAGCYRGHIFSDVATQEDFELSCKIPSADASIGVEFVGRQGQVNLLLPKPGKGGSGKVEKEAYFVIGVLEPTNTVPNPIYVTGEGPWLLVAWTPSSRQSQHYRHL